MILSDPPSPTSGPVLQLLANGLQFWLRQQCDVQGHLNLQLHGSALNLLRGRLEGVTLQARRVTFQELDLELVELRSGQLRVQMGNLLQGQPLQLEQVFDVQGQVSLSADGLSRSFCRPRWRGLADWLAEQLLGIAPLLPLRVEGNRLVLAAQGVGSSDRVEVETELVAGAEGLTIRSARSNQDLLKLPIDPAISLESARIEAGMVLLEGRARVRP